MTSEKHMKKVGTIFNRVIKNATDERVQVVYYDEDNVYCTDGHRAFMVKGSAADYDFTKTEYGDAVLRMIRPTLENHNEAFTLPTVAEVKQYIKDNGYKRSKSYEAYYQLDNKVYVNAFYLLDALEVVPDAKGYWTGKMMRLGSHKEKYRCAGGIHITDGENLCLLMPIVAPVDGNL